MIPEFQNFSYFVLLALHIHFLSYIPIHIGITQEKKSRLSSDKYAKYLMTHARFDLIFVLEVGLVHFNVQLDMLNLCQSILMGIIAQAVFFHLHLSLLLSCFTPLLSNIPFICNHNSWMLSFNA